MMIQPPPEIVLAGTSHANEVVPTHVWGTGAEALAAKWGAKWSTGPFADFRKTFHLDKPLVIVFAGNGEYDGQDWFLGERPNQEVYLFGEKTSDPPTLKGDGFALAKFSKWYLKGLDLSGCSNTSQSFRTGAPTDIYITQCTLRDTNGDQNGWGTPNDAGSTGSPFAFYLWDSVLSQLGSKGNTRHALYIHGRPEGILWVKGITANGSKGCSLIKSTCVTNYVGSSFLSSVLDPSNLALGLKSSILIDVPADSDTTVESNLILMYRGAKDAVAGQVGLDNGAIAWRARRSIHASDRPPYMSDEWKDSTFWTQRARPFRKIVQNNHFKLLAGSPRSTPPLVAQGTHPRTAVQEFGPTYIETLGGMLPYWWERDYTDDYGNTYEGFPNGGEEWDMMNQDNVVGVGPAVQWGPAPKYLRTVPSTRNRLLVPPIPL